MATLAKLLLAWTCINTNLLKELDIWQKPTRYFPGHRSE